jgi:hypothetical protein
VENAFGDGDYWVVADSFPTTHVSIVKFADSKVTSDLQDELRTWLSSNHGVSST